MLAKVLEMSGLFALICICVGVGASGVGVLVLSHRLDALVPKAMRAHEQAAVDIGMLSTYDGNTDASNTPCVYCPCASSFEGCAQLRRHLCRAHCVKQPDFVEAYIRKMIATARHDITSEEVACVAIADDEESFRCRLCDTKVRKRDARHHFGKKHHTELKIRSITDDHLKALTAG
jgi:hypothetical protein